MPCSELVQRFLPSLLKKLGGIIQEIPSPRFRKRFQTILWNKGAICLCICTRLSLIPSFFEREEQLGPYLCYHEAQIPEVFNSPRQILTLLNKVPGYWLQGETDLANKPRNMQIFPHSKFGIDRTAGLKVMAKKFKFWPKQYFGHNFWASGPIDPKFWVW